MSLTITHNIPTKKLFEEWFLNYKPDDIKIHKQKNKPTNKKKKNKSNKIGFLNLYNNNSKTRKNKKDIY